MYIQLALTFLAIQLNVVHINTFLICEPTSKPTIHVHDFNCSHLSISWENINKFQEGIYQSISIDLSYNSFRIGISNDFGLIDYGFDLFTRLTDTLNLSNNHLSLIENYAFHYEKNDYQALRIKILDLSSNNLTKIPLVALSFLEHLFELDLSSNQLNIIEINPNNVGKINIKKLILRNCNINQIDVEVFKRYFPNLQYLDLSYNNLVTLNPQFGYILPSGGLNLAYNPLICNCSLIWFKFHLTSALKDPQNCLTSDKVIENISSLDKDKFTCDIEFVRTSHMLINDQLRLECEVTSYPKVHIGWNYGDRTLSKLANEPKYDIIQDILNKSESNSNVYAVDFFHTKSELIINLLNKNDIGKYSCVVKYTDISLNESIVKIIDIEEEGYKFAEEVIFEQNKTISSRIIVQSEKSGDRFRFIYLVYIFLASFFGLFLLVIILFMTIVLLRQKFKAPYTDYDNNETIYEKSNSIYYENTAKRIRIREHNDLPDEKKRLSKCPHAYILNDSDSIDDDVISMINTSCVARNDVNESLAINGIIVENDYSEYNENIDDYNDPSLVINLRKPQLLPREISV